MASYTIDLSHPPNGHVLPSLLVDFADWLADQPHGSVGWFDVLHASPIDPDLDSRERPLADRGFSFLKLPDGSQLALVDVDTPPSAVVLLDSEGGVMLVARSLEAFLVQLAKGKTGVNDLDDDEAGSARAALADWLGSKKVKAPRAPKFDFDDWLAQGTESAIPPPPAPPRLALHGLPAEVARVASFIGRRADDPELVTFLRDELGHESPTSVTDEGANVEAENRGLSLSFHANVRHEDCPPLPRSARKLVPYLTGMALNHRFRGPLPFGLEWGMDDASLEACLGPPSFRGMTKIDGVWVRAGKPGWRKAIDDDWGIDLDVSTRKKTGKLEEIGIGTRIVLELFDTHTPKPLAGLFVAWAAERALLEERRFTRHAALLADVKARRRKGSELVAAALPRGVWDVHLKDAPGLRQRAYEWIHEPDSEAYYKRQLGRIFGLRENPYGHDDVVLDDDDWLLVDQAAPVLDRHFADFLK